MNKNQMSYDTWKVVNLMEAEMDATKEATQ